MLRHQKASMLLWAGVVLMLAALIFPWGVKHVVEDSSPGPGGEMASHRLNGLDLVAEGPVPGTDHRTGYFESYYADNPDHNLPASRALAGAGPAVVAGMVAVLIGASVPWIGAWLSILALVLFYQAMQHMEVLRRADVGGMPALPPAGPGDA